MIYGPWVKDDGKVSRTVSVLTSHNGQPNTHQEQPNNNQPKGHVTTSLVGPNHYPGALKKFTTSGPHVR